MAAHTSRVPWYRPKCQQVPRLPARPRSPAGGHRLAGLVVLGTLLQGGCRDEPFRYVRVSGSVTYDDGSLIPADLLVVQFEPLAPPEDPRLHPPVGVAYVNPDGTFDVVTSHKYDDGLVRGEHRVLIVPEGVGPGGQKGQPLIPPEYSDPRKTPLRVHTSEAPFHIRVPRFSATGRVKGGERE